MKHNATRHSIKKRLFLTILAGTLLSAGVFAFSLKQRWGYVPCPQHPTATNAQLKGVTALSQIDAWAVGRWFDPNVKIQTLHWDGRSWRFIDPPNTTSLGGTPDLDGVDHSPNGDVWAVGSVYTGYPTDNNPLVMRWRNGSWDYVNKIRFGLSHVYPYAERGGAAYDVACISENDVWVVGYASGHGDDALMIPMAAHWNGSGWTEFDVPWFGNRYNLIQNCSASGPDDIWAVGSYRNYAQDYHAFMVHWDGTQWSHVPTPIEGMSGDSLWDVAALAPDDAWAVGSIPAGGVIMHWNGTQWSLFADPSTLAGGFSYLAPISRNDIWAVAGDNSFWHYDGVSWTQHSNPTVPGASSWWRSGGMAASGPNDVWSIGGWTSGSLNNNLTEHFPLKTVPRQ